MAIYDPSSYTTSFTRDANAPKQQYSVQQPDANTNSSNIGLVGGAHLFAEPPPRIFALIIGINKYKNSPHIPNLEGAVPDADDMRDYLQNHLGVPSNQIKNLRNGEATRAAIIGEIKALSLNKEIEEGDPILIYFAGHGRSEDTPKGWEVWSSGKIELLVPYDSDHSSLEGGNLQHGIPDRTLGALLSQLAIEKGDNITVILDCCHSSSATRAGKKISLDSTYKARQAIHIGNVPSDLDEGIWTGFESSKGLKRATEVPSGFARSGLMSHVLLAACRPLELAYERTSRGLFTVALLTTLVKIGIDKLTYATLFDHYMPPLTSGQSPQCEGNFRERLIFNGKASDKRTAGNLYKIRKSDGEKYVIDAGEAVGISMGAEYEVYQDRNFTSGDLLGTVVVRELSAFSTTLYAKKSKIVLERDGFALKSRAGTEELVRVYVADERLKDLVKKIDPNERIIQLVEEDHGAEFGMALENGNVVFHIYDSEVRKYGLTRMAYDVEPTIEAISPVIRGAAQFYWHRRRTLKTGGPLAGKVKIEVAELQLKSVEYDDDLQPVGVYGPTAFCDGKGGKEFELQTETTYGWRITNNSALLLYPALFYFDNSDLSITPYYVPPTSTAQGIVEPPLKGKGHLTVGYGEAGSVPSTFLLREEQDVDVGILKLFLSVEQIDLSHIAQSSPFLADRAAGPPPKLPNFYIPWDTVEIPVVQRRAKK